MAIAERILIIGTNPLAVALIQGAIQSHSSWKHSLIDICSSVDKAANDISVMSYQLVLVDCQASDVSPLEILIRLRAVDKKIPLILINEPGMEKTAISCLKNGCDYYLVRDRNWKNELPTIMETVLHETQQREKVKKRIAELEEENKKLKSIAILDDSTLFYSADHFHSLLSRELKRAYRHSLDLACLILDIQSHAKPYILKQSSKETPRRKRKKLKEQVQLLSTIDLQPVYEKLGLLLKSVVRSSDIWARLDQNRFVALLPHTTAHQAANAIKRIQSEISGTKFQHENSTIPLKISWGLANYDKNKIKCESDLLDLATSSLHEA